MELIEKRTTLYNIGQWKNDPGCHSDLIRAVANSGGFDMKPQCVTSKPNRMGLRHAPMALTEQGIA